MANQNKNKIKKYKKVVEKSKFWPIVKLFKNRDKFMQNVSEKTKKKILKKTGSSNLYEEIINTIYKEKQRISNISWNADPKDDKKFWYELKYKISKFKNDKKNKKISEEILPEIIDRYTKEITGNFKRTHYSFAKRVIISFLGRLLNASRLRNPFGNLNLDSTISIVGKKNKLRKLSKKGTIVMVPTHFSHLDSALIGYVISHLGLPAFMYGAGLVLYNLKIFAYFFNSLGAYKVDRRKKHLLYLETLKTYTEEAIINECHNLFYPGGTRSRSGAVEKNLKLGLLGSALEAQKEMGKNNKKIFIVPITFNYQFVLEGPALINQYISSKSTSQNHLKDLGFSNTYKILLFLIKYFTQSNKIAVTIGDPMDVFGNKLDKNGDPENSQDFNYKKMNKKEILSNLSDKIIEEFKNGTVVFPSSLIAFTTYQIIKGKFKNIDIINMISLPDDEVTIRLKDFKKYYIKTLKHVDELAINKKIRKSNELDLDVDKQILIGCQKLGLYHTPKPLIIRNKSIIIKNMKMLYYYRNRLDGFGIEKSLSN